MKIAVFFSCFVLFMACQSPKTDYPPTTTRELFYKQLAYRPILPNTDTTLHEDEVLDINYQCANLIPGKEKSFWKIVIAYGSLLDKKNVTVTQLEKRWRESSHSYRNERLAYYGEFNGESINTQCYTQYGDTCIQVRDNYSGFYVPVKYFKHLLQK